MTAVSLEDLAKLADGRTAEVYEWNGGRVLKLYREGWDRAEAEHEFEIARRIHQAGVRTPAAHQIVEIAGRAGVVYERVDGPSLLVVARRQPWRIVRLGQQLADLHFHIHRHHISGLRDVRDNLRRKIERGPGLTDYQRGRVLTQLERLPDGDALLHNDFHPDNVLDTAQGHLVIDWVDASRGHPLADAARTLVMARHWPLYGRTAGERLLFALFSQGFQAGYVLRYLDRIGATRSELESWMGPVAAGRLSEEIAEEHEALIEMAAKSIS